MNSGSNAGSIGMSAGSTIVAPSDLIRLIVCSMIASVSGLAPKLPCRQTPMRAPCKAPDRRYVV